MPYFVVHEHWASHHHFDFRLEMDGVLKSWAVPKGPPTGPGIKRLAMRVDDHPLEYGTFEGTISEGNYGAGKVLIWDNGDYVLIERKPQAITFELEGRKLRGRYNLVHFEASKGKSGKERGNEWLLFKSND